MYDKAWNVHPTEFDIVEDGNVPLLMSLPQMRNLAFQFELSPQKSSLNFTRRGIWKHQLRMSKSIHVVMDFQDIAWYMSAVYFKIQNSWGDRVSFRNMNTLNTVNCLLRLLLMQIMMIGGLTFTGKNWSVITRHFGSQLFKMTGSKSPISFWWSWIYSNNLYWDEEWSQKGTEGWLESSLWSRETFWQTMAWKNCFQDQGRSCTFCWGVVSRQVVQ